MKKIFLFVAAVCATAALNAGVVTVEPGTQTIEAALATFTEGDTLLLSTGTYAESTYQLNFDKKITLLAAEGATPEVSFYEAKMSADFAAEGLSLTNYGKDNRLIRMGAEVANISFKNCSFTYDGGSYTIYLSSNVGNLSIEDCSFNHKGASYAIFSNSDAKNISIKNCSFDYEGEAQTICFDENTTVGSLTIDGCLFTTGNATSQKDFILEARYTAMTDFTLTNSTVMNAGIEGSERAFYCIPTNALVDHCTFYNCGVHNVYISGENLTTCQVKNCISVSPVELGDYCIKTYAGTVENCLYYNIGAPRSSDAEVIDCINADPLFVDAANGDLALQAGSPAIGAATDGTNLGDPRWTPKPKPVLSTDTLDNTAAVLVGKQLSLTEDNVLSWYDNQPGCSATWTLNLQQGDYAIIINQTTGSGHNFKVEIQFADGRKINSVSEGADSWDDGDLALDGVLYAPEDGEYKLILTNGTEWSGANAVYVIMNRYEYSGGYVPVEDGLNNIKAGKSAIKRIHNGQIVIMKNGIRYNVLGTRF